MEMETLLKKEKGYSETIGQFLNSLGAQFKELDSKRTDGKSSQSNTMFILGQISKQNEMKKKRELLKQKVMKIEQETGIFTLNVETLLRELLKQDQISVYAFLDQQVSDQLN